MHAIRIVTGTLSALGALWAFLRSHGERHLGNPSGNATGGSRADDRSSRSSSPGAVRRA